MAEPSLYSIEKEPLCLALVEESKAVYLFLEKQAGVVHEQDGTQRSEDPAMMVKV